MKSFALNHNNLGISEEMYNVILTEGFETGDLNCYAHLEGSTCYKKSFTCSIGWIVTCYITEQGMAVDHDYDCGGNYSHNTWWFDKGIYTLNEFNYSTFEYEDVHYDKYAYTFEDAWDAMVEYSTSL